MHHLLWSMRKNFGINWVLVVGNVQELFQVNFFSARGKINRCRRNRFWRVPNTNCRAKTIVNNNPGTLYKLIFDILVCFK